MKAVLILHIMVGVGSFISLLIASVLKERSGHTGSLLLQSICMFLTTLFSGVLLILFGASMLRVCTSSIIFSIFYIAAVYTYKTNHSS